MKKLLLANLVLLNPVLLLAQESTGGFYNNFRLGIGLILFILFIVLGIWLLIENANDVSTEEFGCGCGCFCILLFIVLILIDVALAPMSLSGFLKSLF